MAGTESQLKADLKAAFDETKTYGKKGHANEDKTQDEAIDKLAEVFAKAINDHIKGMQFYALPAQVVSATMVAGTPPSALPVTSGNNLEITVKNGI